MRNQSSTIGTAARILRRYWIPAGVAMLLGIVMFAGQPVWAADSGSDINQTVPTPTPAVSPVAPTATPEPTPENGGNNGSDNGDSTQDTGSEATPVAESAATAEAVEVAAEVPTSTVTLTGTVTAVTLNVRQGPATTFPVIGRLSAGATINVLARNVDGSWLLICCTASGSNGWVSAEFVAPNYTATEAAGLSVSSSAVSTETVTSNAGTVTAAVKPLSGTGTVDVLTLNIRQGPSTSTPVVGRFRQDDTFTVQGTNDAGDWYLVCCVPGTQNTGWISAEFATVSTTDSGATTPETPAAAATPEATPETPAEPTAAPTPDATPTTEPAAGGETDAGTSSGVTDVLW